jgi:hypothetical protein
MIGSKDCKFFFIFAFVFSWELISVNKGLLLILFVSFSKFSSSILSLFVLFFVFFLNNFLIELSFEFSSSSN